MMTSRFSHEMGSLNSSKTQIVGIVNLTPDSFSDGGRLSDRDAALRHIETLISEGADMIDIGAESSRPGAQALSVQEELSRLHDVLSVYKHHFSTPLSLDTWKADVAEFGLSCGVDVINDIRALTGDFRMVEVVKKAGCPVVLMHMKGQPQSMQKKPEYEDVVKEVVSFFEERVAFALGEGIQQLILDPGIGFGKTVTHNLLLLRHLDEMLHLGYPLLIGTSRKSFMGAITGDEVTHRLEGSLASALFAVSRGARFLRVHDVASTRKALQVWESIAQASKEDQSSLCM